MYFVNTSKDELQRFGEMNGRFPTFKSSALRDSFARMIAKSTSVVGAVSTSFVSDFDERMKEETLVIIPILELIPNSVALSNSSFNNIKILIIKN